MVHVPGCDHYNAEPRWRLESTPPPPVVLVDASGKAIYRKKHKNPRKGRVTPDTPPYRMMLQFYFSRPVNIALWKKIKAPPGWRKNPTTAEKQHTYRGVRFQCDDYKYTLTPDEVSQLHMTLVMILEEVF